MISEGMVIPVPVETHRSNLFKLSLSMVCLFRDSILTYNDSMVVDKVLGCRDIYYATPGHTRMFSPNWFLTAEIVQLQLLGGLFHKVPSIKFQLQGLKLGP